MRELLMRSPAGAAMAEVRSFDDRADRAAPLAGGRRSTRRRALRRLHVGLALALGSSAAAPALAQEVPAGAELRDELEVVRRVNAEQQARIEALERELGQSAADAAPPAETPEATTESQALSAEELARANANRPPPLLHPGTPTDLTSPELWDKMLADKWYERLNLRGYVQFRYSAVSDVSGAPLNVPNDRSAADDETFLIRRGRFITSGDVSEHLFLYGQLDYSASPGDGDFALQMRDLYSDISVDAKKEFRFRLGQSKVPYGWVNLQSSQNRSALERPDALNSAVEGERDLGAYFYYAPEHVRKRFRELIKLGLKGSGDYGVFGVGGFTGQGPNRTDENDKLHGVARITYPFELSGGQFIEVGASAYTGDYVVSTQTIEVDGASITPEDGNGNFRDERVEASFIVYPQPIGFEGAWTIGRGPQLSSDLTQIDVESLHGGYLLANYKYDTAHLGSVLPFVRWNYYDGARKFADNSPADFVNELDFGTEWAPLPELEVTLMYTHTFARTNTKVAPYDDTTGANRIGLQVQWNF